MNDSSRLNPFPGLRPFESDEDYLFFGREDQSAELLTRLREHRFIAVVGASGSGKSSLVRAGLLPELHGGTMTQAGSNWEIAVLRPGGDPIGNLAKALCRAELYDPDDAESLPRVTSTLRHSRLGLVEACQQSELEPDVKLAIIVDQFEEIFRFRDSGSGRHDQAQAFVNLLLEAARSDACPIYIVLTMRSDYLGDCARLRGLAEAVNKGEFLIPRLKRTQLRAAIEGPVRVGGAAISNRLVQHLLNAVGDDPDQLPILQHALMRTWDEWERTIGSRAQNEADDTVDADEIDLPHYEASGGMEEALSRHADEVYDAFPRDADRHIAARIFKALTERGLDHRGIRRPTRLRDLAAIVGVPEGDVRPIVDAYRAPGVTFLMPAAAQSLEPGSVVDLSHESLMRVWTHLRGWVEEEAQSARIYRRLADTAALWIAGKAGLFRGPDLQISRAWRETEKPNAAWADQYGGEFTETMDFLDESQAEAVARERAEEAARERELAQANALAESRAKAARNLRAFGAGVSVLAVIAILLAIWAFGLKRNADENARLAEENATAAEKAQGDAEKARDEATRLAELARHEQGTVWLERARVLREEKRHFAARLFAGKAIGFEGYGRAEADEKIEAEHPVLLRPDSEEWRAARNLIEEGSTQVAPLWLRALSGVDEEIIGIAFTPDEKSIVTVSDSGTYLWDVDSGGLTRRYDSTDSNSVVMTADGSAIFVAKASGAIVCYEVNSGERLSTLSPGIGSLRRVVLSPDGERFAASSVSGGVVLGSVAGDALEITHELEGHTEYINALSFSPDGKLLASACHDTGELRLWSTDRTGEDALVQLTGRPFCLAFSPSGDALVVGHGDDDTPITIVDVNTREIREDLPGFEGPTLAVLFAPDSGRFICAEGNDISVWDLEAKKRLRRLAGHTEVVRALALTRDGSLLISGSNDYSLRRWNFPAGVELEAPKGDGGRGLVVDIAFSPTGRWLASIDSLRNVEVHRVSTLALEHKFQPDGAGRFSPSQARVAFHPTDETLAATMRDELILFDLTSGEVTGRLGLAYQSFAFSPDGSLIAGLLVDALEFRDAKTLEVTRSFPVANARVGRLAFHPSGSLIAYSRRTGLNEGSVSTVGVDDGSEVFSHRGVATRLEYSPSGEVLAFGAPVTQELTLLSYAKGQVDVAHTIRMSRAGEIAFSPDGQRIANTDAGLVVVRRVATSEVEHSFTASSGDVRSLAFSPDGQLLATGDESGALGIWELPGRGLRSGYRAEPPQRYWNCRFAKGGEQLLVGGDGLRLMDPSTGKIVETLAAEQATGLAVSRDGNWVASATIRGAQGVSIWQLDTRERFRGPETSGSYSPGMGFSPDAKRLAVPTAEGVVVWDIARETRESFLESREPFSAKYSPDGTTIAAGLESGHLILWRVADGEEIGRLVDGERSGITRIAYSPDGEVLAAGGGGRVSFWSVPDRELRVTRTLATSGWVDVAFSPDGQYLATVCQSSPNAQIWTVATGALRAEVAIDANGSYVDFGPEGLVAICERGGTIHVRRVEALAAAPPRLGEFLTHFRIDARDVNMRTQTNFIGVPALVRTPSSDRSLLSVWRSSDSESELPPEALRSLASILVDAQNWTAAARVLSRVPASDVSEERTLFAKRIAGAVREHMEAERLEMARRLLEIASDVAPRDLVLAGLHAEVGLKASTDLPFTPLENLIVDAVSRRASAEEIAELFREKIRIRREARDPDGARTDLEDLVGTVGLDAAAGDLRAHLGEAVAAVTVEDDSRAAQLRLFALLLAEYFVARARDPKVAIESLASAPTLYGAAEIELLPADAEWSYLDEGAAPSDWTKPEFDDEAWNVGQGPLGFGDQRVATTLRRGGTKYVARTRFRVNPEALSAGTKILAKFLRDDGLVLYLNGEEFLRSNMPEGPLLERTDVRSLSTISGLLEQETHEHVLDAARLREGENVLAAAIYQANPASSDLLLRLELSASPGLASLLPAAEERPAVLDEIRGVLPPRVFRAAESSIRLSLLSEEEARDSTEKDPDAWRFRGDLLHRLGIAGAYVNSLDRATALLIDRSDEESRKKLDDLFCLVDDFLRRRGRVAEADERARPWIARELSEKKAIRINSGGDEFTDSSGKLWRKDRFASRGRRNRKFAEAAAGSDQEGLLSRQRYFGVVDSAGSYRFALPRGRYRVTLTLGEFFALRAGQRTFDVRIEGETVLEGYDALDHLEFAETETKSFEVDLEDDALDIEFVQGDADGPTVSAIEVEPLLP